MRTASWLGLSLCVTTCACRGRDATPPASALPRPVAEARSEQQDTDDVVSSPAPPWPAPSAATQDVADTPPDGAEEVRLAGPDGARPSATFEGFSEAIVANRCQAFTAAIAQDLLMAQEWPEAKRRCDERARLDDPPILVLEAAEVPSPEHYWEALALVVGSFGRWFRTDLAGGASARLTTPPQLLPPSTFWLEVESSGLEPGAGATTTRSLVVCRVPESASAAPRCNRREVARTFEPVGRDNAAFRERWVARWSVGPQSVTFEAPAGRFAKDPEVVVPRAETLPLSAFLEAGEDLTEEAPRVAPDPGSTP